MPRGRGLLPFPRQPEVCPGAGHAWGAAEAATGAGRGLKPFVVPGGMVEATGEAARNRFAEERGLLHLIVVVVVGEIRLKTSKKLPTTPSSQVVL